MEAKAKARWIRMSPYKVRHAAELIRGKGVHDALNILHFSDVAASRPLEKLLQSAVANFMNMEDAPKAGPEDLYIKTLTVDGGSMLKRYRPGAMGRAMPVRKRTCHINIVVEDLESKDQKK